MANFFESKNDEYAERILDFQKEIYDQANRLINDELCGGGGGVLDIGNGSIVNYDYTHLKHLVCADLYVNEKAAAMYKNESNVSFEIANILDLKQFEDNTFDFVIVSYVLHHLAGKKRATTKTNFVKALSECNRVLKPNGKILIVEGVVFRWFELIENIFYPVMQAVISGLGHGRIYQYSLKTLIKLMRGCGYDFDVTYLKSGKYTWIMNMKIPTYLQPTRTYFFRINKCDNKITA